MLVGSHVAAQRVKLSSTRPRTNNQPWAHIVPIQHRKADIAVQSRFAAIGQDFSLAHQVAHLSISAFEAFGILLDRVGAAVATTGLGSEDGSLASAPQFLCILPGCEPIRQPAANESSR